MTEDDRHTPATPATPSQAGWQDELVALLAEIEAARTPGAEARVFARIATLDPDLQGFLVEQMAAQESPEAAAFLRTLAAQPEAPAAVRERAETALDGLAGRGILPTAPGTATFHAGWVQQGRERGEQIMLLGWLLPDGRMEALVFLLDWRGDGLKDFYRTREISDTEWRELVEHNGQKDAPLVPIALGEGRALLEEALAEGQRFSRPAPREYKQAQAVVHERVLSAAALPETHRSYVAPDLAPDAVVAAYVRALHHRDYALAWELLAPDHPAHAGDRAAAIEALRREWKHAPRRKPEVTATLAAPVAEGDETASVVAEGEAESVERTGRRVRSPIHERYDLRRNPNGWRITAIHPA